MASTDRRQVILSAAEAQQLRNIINKLDDLEVENGRLGAENALLKRQLILVRDNAGLKVANVLCQVASWFDDVKLGNIVDTVRESRTSTGRSTIPPMNTDDLVGVTYDDSSAISSDLNTADLIGNSPFANKPESRRDRHVTGGVAGTNDPLSLADLEPESLRYNPRENTQHVRRHNISADSGNQTIDTSHESTPPESFSGEVGTLCERLVQIIENKSTESWRKSQLWQSGISEYDETPCAELSESDIEDEQKVMLVKAHDNSRHTIADSTHKRHGYVWVRGQELHADHGVFGPPLVQSTPKTIYKDKRVESVIAPTSGESTGYIPSTDITGNMSRHFPASRSPTSAPRSHSSRSVSPKSRSVSPKPRSVSPKSKSRRRSRSPKPRSVSPRPRSVSPKPRSVSPRPRSVSPKPRSVSPKPRSVSPKPRSVSPKPRSVSPKPRSVSPKSRSRKRSRSPKPRSVSPKPRSVSPKPRSVSPKPRSVSPKSRSVSPKPRSVSPKSRSRKRSRSPKARSVSPRPRSVSPKARSVSPKPKSVSPKSRSKTRSRSPKPRSVSPKSRSKTRSRSPKPRSVSPKSRSRSPRLRPGSSKARSRSRSPKPKNSPMVLNETSLLSPEQAQCVLSSDSQEHISSLDSKIAQNDRSTSPRTSPTLRGFSPSIRGRPQTPVKSANQSRASSAMPLDAQNNQSALNDSRVINTPLTESYCLNSLPPISPRSPSLRIPSPQSKLQNGSYEAPEVQDDTIPSGMGHSAAASAQLDQSSQYTPSTRLMGELAFQLDRRILNYVFNSVRHTGNKTRFYGYLVKNIPEMINKQAETQNGHDAALATLLNYRYKYVLYCLQPMGYLIGTHADFCIDLVNKYGLLPIRSDNSFLTNLPPSEHLRLRELLRQVAPVGELKDVIVLLDCLVALAKDDGRNLFVW